jgi:NitT/TauT family transport system permease protein
MTQQIKQRWRGPLYGILAALAIWYSLALAVDKPIVPYPHAVFINMTEIFRAQIEIHLLYSFGRISAGIAVSVLLGVPLGYLMGYYPRLDRALSPLIYFTYPIPKLALLPVVMLLFGLGEIPKLIMIVIIVVFQIIIAARDAVKDIPEETFRSLRSLGASRAQKISEALLPASLPELLTAIRIALGTAVSILFFTETFGTERGMGYFIMDAWTRVNYLDMYSGIVTLSLMGFIIFAAIDFLERLLCAWRA